MESYVVCHRSCLGKMVEDDILIKRVNIFTGSRWTRGRLGVLLDNATVIDRDIVFFSKLTKEVINLTVFNLAFLFVLSM